MRGMGQESEGLNPEIVAAVIDHMLFLMELPACEDLEEGRRSIIKAMTVNISFAQYDAFLEQAISHVY